jgi:hypothetical protein
MDELHRINYLEKVAKIIIPKNPKRKKKLFKYHLNRSIHAHIWRYKEMAEFINYLIEKKRTHLDLLELYLLKGISNEVIFILQKRQI